MLIRVCIAKIHRATVTAAELNYIGSITIDATLLNVAGILPYQYVNITNLANGAYWQTYAIPGAAGQGDICLNGPPARHFHPGDQVIILAEGFCVPEEAAGLQPKIVLIEDKNNKLFSLK